MVQMRPDGGGRDAQVLQQGAAGVQRAGEAVQQQQAQGQHQAAQMAQLGMQVAQGAQQADMAAHQQAMDERGMAQRDLQIAMQAQGQQFDQGMATRRQDFAEGEAQAGRAEQTRQFDIRTAMQAQGQQFDQGMATRRQDFAEGEAQAGRAEQTRQFDLRTAMQAQGQQFDQGMANQKIALEAADRGLEMVSPQAQSRMQALQQQMDMGAGQMGPPTPEQMRQQEQASKPLAHDGVRFVPGEERIRKQAQSAYTAETERLKAAAYYQQTVNSFNRARIAGDEDEMRAQARNLMQPIQTNAGRFDRLMNGKGTDTDWKSLRDLAIGHGDESNLLPLIESRTWNERTQGFLRAAIAYDGVRYAAVTGSLPDGDLVDMSSPMMIRLSQACSEVVRNIRNGTTVPPTVGSYVDRNRWVVRTAGQAVLGDLPLPSRYQPIGALQAQDPFGGMTASAGQAPQQPAGPSGSGDMSDVRRGTDQPFADDRMTQEAIAARQRGEQVPPTDSQEFQDRFGQTQTPARAHYGDRVFRR